VNHDGVVAVEDAAVWFWETLWIANLCGYEGRTRAWLMVSSHFENLSAPPFQNHLRDRHADHYTGGLLATFAWFAQHQIEEVWNSLGQVGVFILAITGIVSGNSCGAYFVKLGFCSSAA